MGRRIFSALFATGVLLSAMSAHAAVLDSQLDDSVQAVRPVNDGSFIPSDGMYLTVGYVPTSNFSFSGLRFRVNTSDNGNYLCPAGDIYQYSGTSTPALWNAGVLVGDIIAATTTPDANGNCNYTTIDKYGQSVPVQLSTPHYYVFLMAVGGNITNWVSMNGKSVTASTNQSFFGFRPATHNDYKWGTTGLEIPYFQFFDTLPSSTPADPCVATTTCASNVLFLPGIEGSRLYEGTACGKSAEEKLWEPYDGSVTNTLLGAGDTRVARLALDQSGQSVCNDIYAKEGDVIDAVGGSNLYKSFIDQMNGLKSDGTIKDWRPIAYDWRFSLNDLLTKGAVHNGKIYYEEATSTPYIEQTLRALAASSKTGKVTIIAHSNGGLVAKALLSKLGNSEATKLVDRVIMVAVPQTGAPADIGSLLVGYGAGLYQFSVPIVSNAVARTFAQNSPMAYHLLPSEDYLESTAGDSAHPVIRFSGTGYAKEEAAYGATIANRSALDNFLLAVDGGRIQAADNDLTSAKILNSGLITYANTQHASLDFWTPPAGIKVDQIAGWGVDTVQGVDFYTAPATDAASALNPVRMYRPLFIEDGDGTVPVPSALQLASSSNVTRYWLNLVSSPITHGNIFESADLKVFLSSLLTNHGSALPASISASAPISSNSKSLTFFLHSPLTLQLTDSSGKITGLSVNGSVVQNIPGSTYGQFGEVKYITVPEISSYELTMHGQATGTFTLDVQESTGNTLSASSTIAGVPTTASTTVTMSIGTNISTLSPMQIDENGDGILDVSINPVLNGVAFFPMTYRWDGFLQPINDTAHQVGQTSSVFKGGSTVPVKFQLKNFSGAVLQASASPLWLTPQKGAAMSAPVGESIYSSPGTSGAVYKWDSTAQQYVYNWNTKGLATGYWYQIYAKLDDGHTYSVTVGLK